MVSASSVVGKVEGLGVTASNELGSAFPFRLFSADATSIAGVIVKLAAASNSVGVSEGASVGLA